MLKNKIKKKFKISGVELELSAELFGEKKNNVNIICGSENELLPNNVAFVLGYMCLEICEEFGYDFDDVINNIYKQKHETDELLH